MELVITSQELEPLPIHKLSTTFERPEGLLNSNYKAVVKCNLTNTELNSIFGIKQLVKSRQYQFTSSIETLLKLSVFVTVLAFII
ncbi:hypothetical protein SAMN04515667_1000 [Formosa sp. Hel1_31_208]|uniref:hypothetical protein n=1 Tax=Formosa sp. Hel1_31_208 TaxID=1798225 RepID=UPI00087C70E0|nr:hypothetical protein [Formosa sp. Hel1_31_208]SDR92363.1 hypothetical protein SAMN04515667_1000 [Formosa sp. Hel1_31_208]